MGAGVGRYRDSVHMQAISDGLRRELEAIAAAKGIDLSLVDSAVSYGSLVEPTARYSTLQDLDAHRHTESRCSPVRSSAWGRSLASHAV